MKIILEGVAGKRFGREHNLNVRNPNDAIRALCQRLPGFRAFMESSHEFGIYWRILTSSVKDGINYEQLGLGCKEMVLVPVITGSMGFWQNVLNILIGVALVAFAFTGFGLVSFGAVGTISAGIQSAIAALGFGLIFTGVAGLLSPGTIQKDTKSDKSEADAAIFDGALSTTSQGTPVPLLYGEFLAQTMPVISSYISGEEGFYLGIISEGEIQGLAGPQGENIFLNGARLGNTAVTQIEVTDGTQTVQPATFVSSAGFHLSAGATLQYQTDGNPNQQVVRSFVQPYADNLTIRLAYGPCYCMQSHSGETSAWTRYKDYTTRGKNNWLHYNVRVVNGNGNTIYDQSFSRTEARSRKIQNINVGISGEQLPISITVTRLDRDDPPEPETQKDGNTVDSFQWVKGDVTFISADVTWNERLRYPSTALLGMQFNVAEFTQMPTIHARCRGIRVPTVTNGLQVNYAYSNNPAYVLLDLITNPRYGCGGRTYTRTIAAGGTVVQPGIRMDDIDLQSFRNAAQYCDDNNITFNAYIDGVSDAYDLIKSVAATFQAQIFYAGGAISVVVDRPVQDPSEYRLFSESNVIQEVDDNGNITQPCFVYEGVAKAARRTVANVSYTDASDYYIEKKVAVHHPEGIERYGYRTVDIRALGCTDRAQAARLGRYVLGSDIYNNETVTFKVASEGVMLLPGDVVIIADGYKTPRTFGGRVNSATINRVTTDRDITLPQGANAQDYRVYVYGDTGVTMRGVVDTIQGRNINIQGNFNSVPTALHSWILVNEGDDISFRRYRIQKVKEEGNGQFEIIAIKYDERKFDFMDGQGGNLSNLGTNLFSPQGTPALLPNGINFGLQVNP